VYVRDAAVLCDRGAILCAMGKEARRSEPAALEPVFRHAGIPVHGTIEPPGTLEGGDFVWLNERTAAVGRGYRTNDEGIRQLRALLRGCTDEVVEVPLPHWRGPSDVFHLMSILSPLDADLALVFSPLLPVPFRERLLAMGIALVDVPDAEFETLGCNVLALGPRHCLMTEGNPVTQSRMEAAGVRVVTFPGEEICRKGGGGPTCLTRPLAREG
jgi:N-dimethylarginine dimethylaminohydrolase